MMMINIVNTKIMMVSKHITVRKTWFMGILLPLIALLLILAALAILLACILTMTIKIRIITLQIIKQNKLRIKIKIKTKDNATNEKDQSNETATKRR